MTGAARAGRPPAAGLMLAGITLVALALRIPLFDDSLFGDELSTNFVVHGFGVDSVIGLVGSDQEGTPPLFFLLAWLFKDVGGQHESLRIVSLACGLVSIPLTYGLGRRTVGSTAAAVGACVMAVTPFLVYYSVEARAYALVMLLALVAAYCLVRATDRGGGLGWWAGFGVAVAGAAYAHYTAIFVLAGMVAWAFFARPGSRRPLLFACMAAVVLYLPWLGEFREDNGEPASRIIEGLHPLTWRSLTDNLVAWSVGLPLISNRGWPAVLGPALACGGLALGALGFAWRRRGDLLDWRPSAGLTLVLILALATPVGALLHNLTSPSIFIPRNMVASSPGLALAFGALVVAAGPRLRYVAAGLLLAGLTVGSVKMLDEDQQRPDYAGTVSYIEALAGTGAPVVEVSAPTPGPQTHLEGEWAERGAPVPGDAEIFAIGFAPMDERLDARGSGPPGILDPLPAPSSEELAAQAARTADATGGRMFVVIGGGATLEELRGFGSPLAPFLAALPGRFTEVGSRTFPGFGPFPVTVYVLEDASRTAEGEDRPG